METKQFFETLKQKALPIALKHKANLILIGVILYLVFWPKRLPHTSTSEASGGPGVAATSKPENDNASNKELDPILVNQPGAEGADPKWELPAQLSTAEVQQLVARIEIATDACTKLSALENAYLDRMTKVLDEKVVKVMWPRIKGGGFKDQKLASDWYEIVKDKNGAVGATELYSEVFANQMLETPMAMRLEPIKVRAIGGKVLVGDVVFLKALQSYVDHRTSYYLPRVRIVDDVVKRLGKEFPKEFGPPERLDDDDSKNSPFGP